MSRPEPPALRIGIAAGIFLLLVLVALQGPVQGDETDTSAIVAANNRFAFELYGKLRSGPGNRFLSPFSISTALSMVYAGARGRTAGQMADVLHLPKPEERARTGFAELLKTLQTGSQGGGYQLSIANGLWTERSFSFLPVFLSAVRADYGARVEDVDFVHRAEAVRAEINSWVEQNTQAKIKDLFPPGSLDARTRLALANAIYFKGKWASEFKSDLTRAGPFTAPGSRAINVPLMHQDNDFRYFDGGSFQLLELPYRGGSLAMDVFLPRKMDGLNEFEGALAPEKLAEWLSKLWRIHVRVTIPRFKTTSNFKLNGDLAALGMPLAFAPGADFTGMSEKGKELYLSLVVHKAYVDVNEEGTEAAAATGVETRSLAVLRITEFRADHPFLFLIRDLRHGTILFMGRFENPN